MAIKINVIAETQICSHAFSLPTHVLGNQNAAQFGFFTEGLLEKNRWMQTVWVSGGFEKPPQIPSKHCIVAKSQMGGKN